MCSCKNSWQNHNSWNIRWMYLCSTIIAHKSCCVSVAIAAGKDTVRQIDFAEIRLAQLSVGKKNRTKRTSSKSCHFENGAKKFIKPDLGSDGQQKNGAGIERSGKHKSSRMKIGVFLGPARVLLQARENNRWKRSNEQFRVHHWESFSCSECNTALAFPFRVREKIVQHRKHRSHELPRPCLTFATQHDPWSHDTDRHSSRRFGSRNHWLGTTKHTKSKQRKHVLATTTRCKTTYWTWHGSSKSTCASWWWNVNTRDRNVSISHATSISQQLHLTFLKTLSNLKTYHGQCPLVVSRSNALQIHWTVVNLQRKIPERTVITIPQLLSVYQHQLGTMSGNLNDDMGVFSGTRMPDMLGLRSQPITINFLWMKKQNNKYAAIPIPRQPLTWWSNEDVQKRMCRHCQLNISVSWEKQKTKNSTHLRSTLRQWRHRVKDYRRLLCWKKKKTRSAVTLKDDGQIESTVGGAKCNWRKASRNANIKSNRIPSVTSDGPDTYCFTCFSYS